MLSWNIYKKWLAENLLSSFNEEAAPPSVDQWNTDSRSINKSQWFLPLKGESFNGHLFINKAMESGALGFLYNKDCLSSIDPKWLPYGTAVENTLQALQQIASGWRNEQKNLNLLAITGSVGKTTCKEMTGLIFQDQAPTLITKNNFNNEIGVPKTLMNLESRHRFAVVEMGARHPGDIGLLTRLAKPNISACLNVGTAHLEIFKTKHALLKTKLEIITEATDANIAVVLHDDERLLTAAKSSHKKVISFGFNPLSSIHISNVSWQNKSQMLVVFTIDKKKYELVLSDAHDSHPINAAASLALCYAANLDLKKAVKSLRSFTSSNGRFNVIHGKKFTVIDDCYNANLESMLSGLKSLIRLFPNQEKIVILGDMLELGFESELAHEQVGQFCAEQVKPSLLVTIGKQAKIIAQKASESGFNKQKILRYEVVDDFINANIVLPGKILFIKGSRGVQLDKLLPFYR